LNSDDNDDNDEDDDDEDEEDDNDSKQYAQANCELTILMMRKKNNSTAKISNKQTESYATHYYFSSFYRVMHLVLVRYCYRKSSVRLSVCNADVPWAYHGLD